MGFPFRQEVRVPAGAEARAEKLGRAVLRAAGFDPVPLAGQEGPFGEGRPANLRIWIGERGLRRRGVTSSTAVVPIIAVFVAGSILGGLDGYIVGSPLVGILWVLGSAGAAAIFWLRYGGTYDSELVMLTLPSSQPEADPGGTDPPVVLWAARVRSQSHSDVRVPSLVDGPLRLAREVGALAHELERRVALPVTAPSGSPGRVTSAGG